MNDTQHAAPPSGQPSPGPDDDFDPQRLRSIADMQRSADDRIVAGVCAGAAKYLNVDPIVVRVILAVLTLAGFAGVIIYVAAWLLLPAEGEPKSLVADWFKLDRNEEQVRVAGLIAAVVLAGLSIVGDSSWAWWGDSPGWLIPLAVVFYLFWVLPRRRRQQRAQREPAAPASPATREEVAAHTLLIAQQASRAPRPPRSPALLGLTASLAAIALAATCIYEETQKDLHWTTYLAVALAVVGLGLLIGTFFGNGGPLIAIGILLAVALAIGSVFPSGRIGTQTPTPTLAAAVDGHYQHGIGELELDLTQVADVQLLPGRTITIDAGVGQTRVYVPTGLNVEIDATVKAGQITVLGRDDDGTDVSMTHLADDPTRPALTIDIEQSVGRIEVIRR
ncbi:MAG: PspC domain-containing protein [Aeromicrobium sp.]